MHSSDAAVRSSCRMTFRQPNGYPVLRRCGPVASTRVAHPEGPLISNASQRPLLGATPTAGFAPEPTPRSAGPSQGFGKSDDCCREIRRSRHDRSADASLTVLDGGKRSSSSRTTPTPHGFDFAGLQCGADGGAMRHVRFLLMHVSPQGLPRPTDSVVWATAIRQEVHIG